MYFLCCAHPSSSQSTPLGGSICGVEKFELVDVYACESLHQPKRIYSPRLHSPFFSSVFTTNANSNATTKPQVVVSDKVKNLRRLEAQRNELNAKGTQHLALSHFCSIAAMFILLKDALLFSLVDVPRSGPSAETDIPRTTVPVHT